MAEAATGKRGWTAVAIACLLFLIAAGAWKVMTTRNKVPAVSTPPGVIETSPPLALPSSLAKAPIHLAPKKEMPPSPAPARIPKKAAIVPKAPPKPASHPPAVPVLHPVVPVPVPNVFMPAPPPPAPQEWSGNDTSITHVGQVVIRNDHQWIQFWSEHHPHEAAPEIDFTHDMVLGVFAGPRPAEQFTIRIVNVRALAASIAVDYREKLPPPGTFAVNVTVYPYHLKVIPQSPLPVKFNNLPPDGVVR